MLSINKILLIVLGFIYSISMVHANAVQNTFAKIKPVFTDTIVLDGFAILFIFMGFYALYYTLLGFFSQRVDATHRVRITIAIILSFFSGSTVIFALRDASSGIAVAAGSWLLLVLLVPGFLALAFAYVMFIKNKKDISGIWRFFFIITGLIAIDFLFTNLLIWLSRNANVGGISENVLNTLLRWNSAIYEWLIFFFFIALLGAIFYILSKGGFGSLIGGSSQKSPEQKNRDEMKRMLSSIRNETNEAENVMRMLTENLNNINKERNGITNGYATGTYNPPGGGN